MKVSRIAASVALLAAALSPAACSAGRPPMVVSRPALGTIVTVTAYGADDAALRSSIETAFADMSRVEAELDSYTPTSAVGEFNAAPYEWHVLPPSAVEILDRVATLGVSAQFSPTLWNVSRLYDFGGKPSVPQTLPLHVALAQSRAFERNGASARFLMVTEPAEIRGLADLTGQDGTRAVSLRPGLDFGGAAKGLAIGRAMALLRGTDGIEGAMVTAGSSTRAWGRKSGGEPWRIGIEDPRRPGKVVAEIGALAPESLAVSTSGDYQQFFTRNGMRYHHILDPRTGQPARGLRSLTVYGSLPDLDADILSTALFVMGPVAAEEWAQRNRVGLYAIDDRGRVIAVSAPRGDGTTFQRRAAPDG